MFLNIIINDELIDELNRLSNIELNFGMYKFIFNKQNKLDITNIKNVNDIIDSLLINAVDIIDFNNKLNDYIKMYKHVGILLKMYVDIKLQKIVKNLNNPILMKYLMFITHKTVYIIDDGAIFTHKVERIDKLLFQSFDETFINNCVQILTKNKKYIFDYLFIPNIEYNIIINEDNYVIDGNYKILIKKILDGSKFVNVYVINKKQNTIQNKSVDKNNINIGEINDDVLSIMNIHFEDPDKLNENIDKLFTS